MRVLPRRGFSRSEVTLAPNCRLKLRTPEKAWKHIGFSLIELLVVVAIIALLAALVLPGLSRAKQTAHLARCKSNLRQMGIALNMYVQDFGFYPGDCPKTNTVGYWFEKLEPYTHAKWTQGLYDCPGFPFDRTKIQMPLEFQNSLNQGEYDYNELGTSLGGITGNGPLLGLGLDPDGIYTSESRVKVPSDMIALGDAYDEPFLPLARGLTQMWGYQNGDDAMKSRARASTRSRHTGVFNVTFCDGHVEHKRPSRLFGQDDTALKRFNNDNQPHRGQWLLSGWPTIVD